MFLDAAIKTGVKMILFATREFEAGDIDELLEQLEDLRTDRATSSAITRRACASCASYEGVTCSLELAFDYNPRLYVYELQPDWYEEFLVSEDEIDTRVSEDEIDDDGDSLGGYFSKN